MAREEGIYGENENRKYNESVTPWLGYRWILFSIIQENWFNNLEETTIWWKNSRKIIRDRSNRVETINYRGRWRLENREWDWWGIIVGNNQTNRGVVRVEED